MRMLFASPVPLFRSDAQFAILGELFTTPDLEVRVTELAERIGVPVPTVSREVARLIDAELLIGRRDGRRHLLSANREHPLTVDLHALLTKTYGPIHAISAELAATDGIDRGVIFGSFAARSNGDPGPAPRDVDLLVIGDVDVTDVWSVAARLSEALGIDVNPVVRTAEEWAADTSRFAESIREHPQIELDVTG